ncbi:N-acetyltransferase [Jeotgalibacillus sp. S-D1]|uniref:GNAT family N-acetyltransferase n=1 Tax=Jeotgalibacillus sp. S-D1 TaxID=2552189 RepID=UPI00105A2AA4|nr:GNAT family N-acetyltransferase [Jeotgalibacillus sp. S-D1]TDL30946.1 N-acetyltransferase [Jeotgalibacillus sp. S-D1]
MNPILLDFPEEFSTDRLLIRAPKPGDGEAVWEAINASRADLKPWLHFASKEETKEAVEANIRESQIRFLSREDLRLLVFLKDTGQFVGSSGLHRINWDIPKFEIGYWIDSRMSGKGYMTEAVEGITDFAFSTLKAKRVEIRCNSKNSNSIKIPEKLAYTLEGVLRNDLFDEVLNESADTCVFAKIAEN